MVLKVGVDWAYLGFRKSNERDNSMHLIILAVYLFSGIISSQIECCATTWLVVQKMEILKYDWACGHILAIVYQIRWSTIVDKQYT
jgi:hypothetical protein